MSVSCRSLASPKAEAPISRFPAIQGDALRFSGNFSRASHNVNARAEAHGELALTIPMACVEARKAAAT